MKKVNVYGVKIPLNSPRHVAKYLYKKLERGERAIIFTPNFQMLKSARKDIQIASMLNKADLLLPDGIGVSLLCGRRVQRIAGIDAGYALLKYSAAQGKKVSRPWSWNLQGRQRTNMTVLMVAQKRRKINDGNQN